MSEFATADSGERLEFDSGMRRDTTEGKTNWLLVRPGPMLRRWAELMTRGSVKYEADRQPGELRNWQRAEGLAEYERFLESFARHAEQYLTNSLRWMQGLPPLPDGEDENGEPMFEDHGAACFFNLNGAEYVRERIEEQLCDYVPVPAPDPVTKSDPWEGTLGFSRDLPSQEMPLSAKLDAGMSLAEALGEFVAFDPCAPTTRGCCGDPSDCGGCGG